MRQRRSNKISFSGIIFGVLLILNGVCFVTRSWAGDVLIIGHQDIPGSNITQKEIKSIFLGEQVKWKNGGDIRFVLFLSRIHDSFLKEYIGITSTQYRNYWKKKVFTGQARSPKSFKSKEKLLDYIAETKGAVGYIPSDGSPDDSIGGSNSRIKIITVK
ncbi:hypothetical protein QUF76_13020 [Desulfobacterales bacterium HSG16]|nr:hypothetical protein [Desulfobacterales bacterium HSG16]